MSRGSDAAISGKKVEPNPTAESAAAATAGRALVDATS
jgi:hypothetical protein